MAAVDPAGGAAQRGAHRALLCARSERMRRHLHFDDSAAAFLGPSPSSDGERSPMPVFHFLSLSPSTLLPFLEYVYGDASPFPIPHHNSPEGEEEAVEGLVELALTGDEYLMPSLVQTCESLLLPRLNVTNCVHLFRVAGLIPALADNLRPAAAAFIATHFGELVQQGRVGPVVEEGEGEEEEDGALTPAGILEMAFRALG